MDVAVLYHHTIMKYKEKKCPSSASDDCIHRVFDGEEYFNKFILNHEDIKHLYDESNGRERIRLDACGDSSPTYAIYQLQSSLEYKVSSQHYLIKYWYLSCY